jgi:GntR family transcriptional regulator
MRAQGMEPTSQVLVLDQVRADDVLAERLAVRPGDRLVHLERLRLADGEPMAIERTYLSAVRFPGLRRHLVRLGSLYAALDTEYGVRPVEAEETIETALASPEEAALLGVDTGLPLLLLSRHSLDLQGEPVEYVRSVYRGDRYKFVTRLSRPDGGP